MAAPPQQPLPAIVGECVTVMQPAGGTASPPSVSKMMRSVDGKLRCDAGTMTVITDPVAQRTLMIDHLKKEAQIISMKPPGLPAGQVPPVPAVPVPPGGLEVKKIEDLGKSVIDGFDVVGKRFTMQPPATPQAPAAPSIPMISEVWTSTKFQMPVLTKTKGSFGEEIKRCRYAESVPPPAMFEIPPGYTSVVMPVTIKPPAAPGVPGQA